MIELKDIVSHLEKQLTSFSIGSTNYVYRLRTDTDNYKAPSREANQITQYIHGIAFQTGSDIESLGDSFNGTVEMRLELLVPVKRIDDDNIEIVTNVRATLDNYFATNANGTLTAGGKEYVYGVKYTLLATGTRQMFKGIGDCLTFTCFLRYIFIEDGVNSRSIRVFIDGHELGYQRMGEHRQAVQESMVNADDSLCRGVNVTEATQYTLNIECPLLDNAACNIIKNFVRNGDLTAHLVELYRNDEVEHSYIMLFNESGLNYETSYNASVSVKLVEANTKSGTVQLSAAAEAYLKAQEQLEA